jgi:nucleotide-binding universal stress UspA family protein
MTVTNNIRIDQADELRVVVGYDGSPGAKRAVAFAAHEAAQRAALLLIVSAYDPPIDPGQPVVRIDPLSESAERNLCIAEAYAHHLESEIVIKGEVMVSTAGPALVNASQGASLLVVGTKGRSDLASHALGSVSTYVLHHASCEVTVVRMSWERQDLRSDAPEAWHSLV